MHSATTQALTSLVITGPLRAVEAHPDGSWTVTPVSGPPLLLLNPDEAHAYLERAEGTGPQALASAAPRAAGGCECVPATTESTDPRQVVDLIEARAITQQLGVLGIPSRARAAAWDATIGAAVARVDAAHGLYAVVVPAQGRRYVVLCNGHRIGTLSAVRGPGVTDSYVATQYAAILRDRGDYDPR